MEGKLSKAITDVAQSPWAEKIPEEILLKILSLAICENGPVPLLCRTACVCVYWRYISYHEDLWKSVDLSSGWINKYTCGVHWLSQSRFGEYTISLDLEAWFKLKDEHLKVIDQYCPNLTTLNVSSCDSLTGEGLHVLADGFTSLQNIKLSNMAPIALGSKDLSYLLHKKGGQLVQLVLSHNGLSKTFSKNMADIYNVCPNLLHLDLSYIHVSGQDLHLDIQALQRGCPKLKVLNLEGTSVHCNSQEAQQGFLDLEEFYVPHETVCVRCGHSVHMITRTSFKLKRLQYYMSKGIVDLSTVPTKSLRHLKLPIALTDVQVFKQIRWSNSLQILDLKWITGISRIDMDKALVILFTDKPYFHRLMELYLCGTLVSWRTVSAVIENCRNLRFLNCTFCSNVPKFWAREIQGDLLKQLYRLINEGMSLEELKGLQEH